MALMLNKSQAKSVDRLAKVIVEFETGFRVQASGEDHEKILKEGVTSAVIFVFN